ncbi:hypothetical protein [Kineothrix sp. MB12-C1]|uniref:hypothetical protein n=1 Tax=Kineothrix sp. MB12-C1 TaxID=3070215 RepID=UPI0027D3095B|nr:hypothetical protein [Kineothrix sp. MB12-C1]WMC91182.1 hypothetical protein RBB56_09805 [Kineothrix sp. MB12-C1]
MIKEFLKSTLLFAAIIILTVFAVSYLSIGTTPEIVLVFELFFLSFLITFIQQLLKQMECSNFLLNIVIEYFSVSVVVLLYGYFVQWFFKSNWWIVFVYVAIVYVPAYFLDAAIVKKDINYINIQLEQRRKNEENI